MTPAPFPRGAPAGLPTLWAATLPGTTGTDTTLLGEVTSSALVQLVNGGIGLVGAVVLMGVVDLQLLLVTLAVLTVVGAGIGTLLPRIARAVERSQKAVGELGAALERSLGAIRTVKLSGAEARETARLDAASERAYLRGLESAGYQAVVGASTGLVIQLAFLTVLGLGGARVADGSLSIGDLIAFLLYLFYLSEPIAQLAQGATQLQGGVAAIRRLGEVEALAVECDDDVAHRDCESNPEVRDPSAALAARPDAVVVTFDGINFTYAGGSRPALADVTLGVPARGLTAVVGPSGSGKTTMFSLLERFYEPQVGSITFGGRDLRDWPRDALRAEIAYVEQEAPVLAGTLADNLRYAAPEASDDELSAVLSATRLDGLVARLPAGLQTEVGSRGVGLSDVAPGSR